MKHASETEMYELRGVSGSHTVNSTDNELSCGRDSRMSALRQASYTPHSSPPKTSVDGDGSSESAVSGLEAWMAQEIAARKAARQAYILTLIAQENSNGD
jgi:hypothetical protein